MRTEVENVPGAQSVAGLGVTLVGGQVPGQSKLADVAVVGYEQPTTTIPAPAPPGQGYADRSLERDGVSIGDTIGLGPTRYPVSVIGWVDDANYLLQGGLWVDASTWRGVLAASRPDANLPEGTFQALTVTTAPGSDPTQVASDIDSATNGTTGTLTRHAAVLALPGINEQSSTFTSIILVTVLVAVLVIALFFALLTLERIGLYAVLKALGASTGQIFVGVVVQALVVVVTSFILGAVAVYALSPILRRALPFQLVVSRTATTFALLLIAATIGSALSLRRVVRVDPASAIG